MMFNPTPKPEPRKKKAPKPLKRTPLPKATKPIAKVSAKRKAAIEAGLVQLKVQTPIKQVSSKQAANLRKYEKGKVEKYENEPTVCTGCGRYGQISCSHLVARSHSFQLVSEKANHEMQCFACADLTERGQFFALKNGLQLLERLWSGLGKKGKERFYYVLNQWPQNQDLWQHSSMIDEPCDDGNSFKELS